MSKTIKKAIATCLSISMVLSIGPTFATEQPAFNDISNHWAQSSIKMLTEVGLLGGYEDGTFRPNANITRAELAVCLQRIFGLDYKSTYKIYGDVQQDVWYSPAVAVVGGLGIMNSYDNKFYPNEYATREEVAYAIVQAYRLYDIELTSVADIDALFTDGENVSEWAEAAMEVLVTEGLIAGRPDGTLDPTGDITRAEVVTLFDNVTGRFFTVEGEYVDFEEDNNVVINTPDVVLKDAVIEGNLYIAQGVGDGDITLENVEVKGTLYIEGGGENSIYLKDSKVNKVVVDKHDHKIRVHGDASTTVSEMVVQSGTVIEGDLYIKEVIVEVANVILNVVPDILLLIDETITVSVNDVEISSDDLSDDLSIADIITSDTTTSTTTSTSSTFDYSYSGGYYWEWDYSVSQVATPVISLSSGTYEGAQQVSLSVTTSNADIYYTLDGSMPTSDSTLYSGPITIDESVTLRAIAIRSGYTNSAVTSATYVITETIEPETPDPETPDPETPDPETPEPETPDPETPDPETPDPDPETPDPETPDPDPETPDPETPDPDPETPEPETPDPETPDPDPETPDPETPDPDPETPDPETPDPDPETPDPEIPDITLEAPQIYLQEGAYDVPQQASIWVEPGTTVHYTLDGTDPTVESAEYKSPITIDTSLTLKAIAAKDGVTSEISTAKYIITSSSVDETDRKWNLVWEDEFNSIDETKWQFQIGTSADGGPEYWGNNEQQYYTKENSTISADGELVISALSENMGDRTYTSSRLWTNPAVAEGEFEGFSATYGKFEARISLPAGDGLWPAFWLLPVDSPYGGWAAGGEIDIMEARGRVPGEVDGTIHYGGPWPNNVYSGGSYHFEDGTDITDYHTYAVEWLPGEINWYVDDVLYHTENNWYSKDPNESFEYAFPAPFDQEFYIILNLAVGGTYDGNLTPGTLNAGDAEMKVDYVRVYELDGGYDEDILPPTYEKDDYPEDSRQPSDDGNFVLDPNLTDVVSEDTLNTQKWNFLTAEGGAGNVTQLNGEDGVMVNITSAGSQTYSIQLIDHFPLATGRIYELEFDAKADGTRTMTTVFGSGEEKGWTKYSEANTSTLKDDWDTYTYRFMMTADTDPVGRVEFNMGTNATNVYLRDVSVKEVDYLYDYEEPKEPTLDGNHIYNGRFDLGDGGSVFWEGDATISKGSATIKAGEMLYQRAVSMLGGNTYELTFDATVNGMDNLELSFTENPYLRTMLASETIMLKDGTNTIELELDNDYQGYGTFLLTGGSSGSVEIDNVVLKRTTNNNVDWDTIKLYPLTNGDFSNGTTGWDLYDEWTGSSFSVEDGVGKVNVASLGSNAWSVMLMNSDIEFTNGFEYGVTFDIWSDVERTVDVALEDGSYDRIVDDSIQINAQKQTFTYQFDINSADTRTLKFLLGNVEGGAAGNVYIDNVDMYAILAPIGPSTSLTADSTDNKLGEDIEIAYVAKDTSWSEQSWAQTDWEDAITAVLVDGKAVTSYSVADGVIKFDANTFTQAGDYSIVIEATDYFDSAVTQKIFSADGNLIINGDFETNDMSGWNVNQEAGESIVDATDGSAQITIIDNGGQHPEWNVDYSWSTCFGQNISVETGKTYLIEFDAKSTIARPIGIELKKNDWEAKPIDQMINLTTDMETYTIQYTASEDLDDVPFTFLLGYMNNNGFTTTDSQHTITIDNISIKEHTFELTGEDRVYNGNFDDGEMGWTLFSYVDADAEFEVVNGEGIAKIVDRPGGALWSVALQQSFFTFEEGTEYMLTFDAKADSERTIPVELQQNDGNLLDGASVSREVTIGTVMDTYQLYFTPTSDTMRLRFLLGLQGASTFTFDNVSLVKAPLRPDAPIIEIADSADGKEITLTGNGNIYYTIDGSTPTASSSEYTAPFTLTETATIKAVVISDGISSEVTTELCLIVDSSNVTNLLSNGGFDDNTAWQYWNGGEDTNIVAENGTFTITVDNTNGGEFWHTQLFQSGVNIEAGKTYVISFDAKSDEARDILVEIPSTTTTSTYNRDAAFGNHHTIVPIGTDMETHTFTVTADGNGAIKFNFCLGNIGNTPFSEHDIVFDNVWLFDLDDDGSGTDEGDGSGTDEGDGNNGDGNNGDGNISGTEVGENLVTNGSFDTTDNWFQWITGDIDGNWEREDIEIVNRNEYISTSTYQSTTTRSAISLSTTKSAIQLSSSDYAAKIDVDNTKVSNGSQANEFWHTQLGQEGFAIRPGVFYKVSFDAYSSVNRDIVVEVGTTSTNGTQYGDNANHTLVSGIGPAMETYSYIVTGGDTDNSKILFHLGNVNDTPQEEHFVLIDNVTIIEIE
ncbi:MAG: hypothetical protein BEN18_06555 [Epulopiscium sp. Nuni2H_MBin001]|nr:MAG: hypothetical protein BEN18_06555 [Epulopiscium sp. Nuni2H_MBin001]